MHGPRVPKVAFTERDGIIAVDQAVNAARCIWRETPTRDVGIDGQIEYVNADGVATGRIVAVQVKSGSSYFARATESYVPYTPGEAHRLYWERHPVPVILALHHPERSETYWVDARSALRNANSIRVPLSQCLNREGVLAALASDGPLPEGEEDLTALVAVMMATATGERDFDVSIFDLFFQGLTDIAHSLYFGMDLAREIQDVKAALPGGTGRIAIGPSTYAFFDTYVAFLIGHDLARVDFSAWRRMAERSRW